MKANIDILTPQELDAIIKDLRFMARYEYDKAKALAQPYIDKYNEHGKRIARKHGRSWRNKTFVGYTK